jgi:hypothetical protein
MPDAVPAASVTVKIACALALIDPSNHRSAPYLNQRKRDSNMRRNVLPNLQDRQTASAEAKKALLEKFRASPGPDDPAVMQRRAAREAMLAERAARVAQREAAKRAHEAELAEQAARAAAAAEQAEREAAELAARLAAEEAEREAALLAEQKAARDERYKARKLAKKLRRKG